MDTNSFLEITNEENDNTIKALGESKIIILDLPMEILAAIFKHLNVKDILRYELLYPLILFALFVQFVFSTRLQNLSFVNAIFYKNVRDAIT